MNKINPQHTYIYARKSTEGDEKQMESIPRQIEIALEVAKRDGTEMPKSHIISEKKSAKVPDNRPLFTDLINLVEKNEHTVIYCWLFNRISRNSKEDGWVRHLIETGKLTIITPHQIFNEQTNAIVSAVEGAQSTQYSRDLSKMIKDANKRRRDHGVCVGLPPPGYKWGGEQGRMRHVPDDHRWQLIHDALHLILKGTTPKDALRALNDEWGYTSPRRKKLGNGPLAESTWYEMVLKNPYYYGRFICFKNTPNEREFAGNHKPMITEQEFWRIQEILGERGRPRPRLHGKDRGVYLRLLTCGHCGAVMTHDRKRQIRCACKRKYSSLNRDTCPDCGLHESKVPKKRKHEYDFWFCPTRGCKQPIFHNRKIEERAMEVLDNLLLPQAMIDLAMEYLETQVDKEAISQEAQLQSLQQSEAEIEKELNRLNQLYVRGGFEHEGGEDEYKRLKDELMARKSKVQQEIARLSNYADDWRGKTEEGYRFCRDAVAAFRDPNAHHRTKRQIFNSVVKKAVIRGDKVRLELEPPFTFLQKKLDRVRTKLKVTEPAKIVKLVGENAKPEIIDALKLTWLWIKDDFRTLAKHKLAGSLSATGSYTAANAATTGANTSSLITVAQK